MKKCIHCYKLLPLKSFYHHMGMRDGRLNQCIECAKRYTRRNYRLRRLTPEGIWREREQCRKRARGKRRIRDAKIMQIYRKRWGLRNPQKKRAQKWVCNAIRAGRLIKSKYCMGCGVRSSRLSAHHKNYERPADVQWLCSDCHGKTWRKPFPEKGVLT